MQKGVLFLLLILCAARAPALEWRRIGSRGIPGGRSDAAVAETGDGGLFVFGGAGPGGLLRDAWLFRPEGRQWTGLAEGPAAVRGARAVHVGDGRILLSGGDDGKGAVPDLWLFDAGRGTWSAAAVDSASDRPAARSGHGMAWDGEDSVVLFGGSGGEAGFLDDTWVYSVSRASWRKAAPQPSPSGRRGFAMVPAGGGKALLFGGEDAQGLTDDLWEFDFPSARWALRAVGDEAAALPPRRRATAFLRAAGRFLLFGGEGEEGLLDDVWELDPERAGSPWRRVRGSIPGATAGGRSAAGCATTADGACLLFGGQTPAGADNGVWAYEPGRNRWSPLLLFDPPRPREDAGLAAADGSSVLLLGGASAFRSFSGEVWSLEVPTGIWRRRSDVPLRLSGCGPSGGSTGTQKTARLGADSLAVVSARVFPPSEPCSMTYLPGTLWLNSVQVLSVPDGVWTETLFRPAAPGAATDAAPGAASDAAPPLRRDYALASDGGRGLVLFGGIDGVPLRDTWIYDGLASRWRLARPAVSPSARSGHAMVSLGPAGVFLFGGMDGTGAPCGDSWLFDPRSGAWRALSPSAAPPARGAHALVALDSSRVLLFGGSDGKYAMDDTWIYDLEKDRWAPLDAAEAPPPRLDHSMALTGDGLLVIFGGRADPGDGGSLMQDAWVLDVSGIR